MEALGKEAVALRLVVKTSPAAQFALLRELRLKIYEALDREGVNAPLARQVVPPAAEDTRSRHPGEAPEAAT